MVVTELEKTKVIFSSLLCRHYPELYSQLSDILWDYHRGIGCVFNTKDYWVRDFMPIQMDENVFVKFIFNPDYLQDEKKYITDVDKVIDSCPFVRDFIFVNVPLVMDGGNMVFCKGRSNFPGTDFVVMTEKVLAENPDYGRQQVEDMIRCSFLVPDLTFVWLPWDREDMFGHTDGIVRYIGVNEVGKPRVLVNLELYEEKTADRMYEILAEHFEVVELRLSEYDELSWAYINSLQTHDFIIIPGLGNPVTDAEALDQYKQLFSKYEGHIFQVQMRDFIAENGGALNCLSWTFYEYTFKAMRVGKYDGRNRKPVRITLDSLQKER